MSASLDASLGFGPETTYRTGVTPTRWPEYTDESLDWRKNIKVGKGLRVGSRVARSARRVIPTADGGGDIQLDVVSKGLGLLWQFLLGTGTSTLVSGTTFQQVFTLGDVLPSFTIQKGIPRVNADGSFTVDPYTFLGCTADSFELDFTNADVLALKATIDAGDMNTTTAYAPPSYAAAPSVFHFAGGSVSSGVLTAPTATALATGTTTLAEVRGGSLTVNHNTKQDRYNFGGGGRKSKPTVGLRDIAGKLDVEYDSTVFRDAVLNDTAMCVILNYVTPVALSAGFESFQVVLPEVKFDTEMPKTNGTDLILQSMSFNVYDNLTAAQPLWIVTRTSDSAL